MKKSHCRAIIKLRIRKTTLTKAKSIRLEGLSFKLKASEKLLSDRHTRPLSYVVTLVDCKRFFWYLSIRLYNSSLISTLPLLWLMVYFTPPHLMSLVNRKQSLDYTNWSLHRLSLNRFLVFCLDFWSVNVAIQRVNVGTNES